MGNKRKSTMQMTPATIVLNAVMVIIIIIICFFAYKFAVESKNPSEDTTSGTTTSQTDDTTPATSVSMTKATTTTSEPETTPEDTTSSGESEATTADTTPTPVQDALPSNYDAEFFSEDLFIGDSITTGLYLYGMLDMKNVAAAQGLSPTKALTSSVEVADGGSMTVTDYAEKMQPKRIYIMLGSNGISPYTSNEAMIDDLGTLVTGLKEKCPDSKVYFLTVTPITKDSTSAARNGVTNELISDYNKLLKGYCDDNGYTMLDVYDLLLDANGYFREDYSEQDGMHFLGKTYKVLLNFIQTSLS